MKIKVAWYRKEDYKRLLATIDDSDKMPKKYEHWFEIAEAGIKSLRQAGYDVETREIDIDALKKWCKANNKKNTLENRAAFAALEAEK